MVAVRNILRSRPEDLSRTPSQEAHRDQKLIPNRWPQRSKPSSTLLDIPHKTYRVTYTITELDADKTIGTEHFSMVVDRRSAHTTVKEGNKIPVATGSYSPRARRTTLPARVYRPSSPTSTLA